MSTTESSSLPTSGPGSNRVGVVGIVLILSSLVRLAALLLYLLIVLLPIPFADAPALATEATGSPQTIQQAPFERDVALFGVTWKMSDEERMLILVITAGALGSLIHALRSAYWYVGNRNLVRKLGPEIPSPAILRSHSCRPFLFRGSRRLFCTSDKLHAHKPIWFLRSGLPGRTFLRTGRAQT